MQDPIIREVSEDSSQDFPQETDVTPQATDIIPPQVQVTTDSLTPIEDPHKTSQKTPTRPQQDPQKSLKKLHQTLYQMLCT